MRMDAKELLRKRMRRKLGLQSRSERRRKSGIIQEKVFSREEFLTSGCIMLYVSRGTGEVETGPIIEKAFKMGKRVVLPVTAIREKSIRPVRLKSLDERLRKTRYGIYEPGDAGTGRTVRIDDIDLVIVPGLAFDAENNRLGHGQGYYDRFLRRLPAGTSKIGLGFRFQLFEKIPAAAHDFSLTRVITD